MSIDWDDMRSRYEAGATLKQLAADAPVSPQTIGRRLAKLGVTMRGHAKTEQMKQRISEAMRRHHFDRSEVERLADGSRSVGEIAAELGVPDEVVRTRMVTWGIPRLDAKARQTMNHFWNGGRTVDKHGYILVKMNDHPEVNRAGYVREHRLVMESLIGRRLACGEVVDHKNGDTSDNRPENLRLFPSNAEHLRATLTGVKKLPAAERAALTREAVRRARQRVDATRPASESGAGL